MITNKTDIEAFLKKYFKIFSDKSFEISEDGIVSIDCSISLNYYDFNLDGFKKLPIQFGHIKGNFVFEHSNITSLKGFPKSVEQTCSIMSNKKLKLLNLELLPPCKKMIIDYNKNIKTLDGLNCIIFHGEDINLKKIGTNFYAKEFRFNNFPKPTADEMRQFIQLNPQFYTKQQAPWITLIKDYYQHKDLFRAISEFETLYNEPWVKPEQKIEIIDNNFDLHF